MGDVVFFVFFLFFYWYGVALRSWSIDISAALLPRETTGGIGVREHQPTKETDRVE